jgi:RNA polymerase sigma-70 factor (ECF subfamily)
MSWKVSVVGGVKGCSDGFRERLECSVVTEISADRVGAFEAMVREHDAVLRRFAYRLVGRDVEDVLQSAYLSAFRALPAFRAESSVSTWLHRIVFAAAMNHHRSNRRRFRRDVLGAVGEFGDDFSADSTSRVDQARAVHRLPIDQRAALLLVDGQGFSYAEAARVLGVAAGTVASRLSRARAQVRESIAVGKDA